MGDMGSEAIKAHLKSVYANYSHRLEIVDEEGPQDNIQHWNHDLKLFRALVPLVGLLNTQLQHDIA